MENAVDELLKKTFIKLRSDYGFKRTFKESKPYKSGEYEDMFNAPEIASMAAEDIVAYRNSIMIEMERQSALEFAKEEGKEEGIEVGKMEVAREMKKKGMLLGDIMLFTGLSEQQIEKL